MSVGKALNTAFVCTTRTAMTGMRQETTLIRTEKFVTGSTSTRCEGVMMTRTTGHRFGFLIFPINRQFGNGFDSHPEGGLVGASQTQHSLNFFFV